jgi:hypothetical protein
MLNNSPPSITLLTKVTQGFFKNHPIVGKRSPKHLPSPKNAELFLIINGSVDQDDQKVFLIT